MSSVVSFDIQVFQNDPKRLKEAVQYETMQIQMIQDKIVSIRATSETVQRYVALYKKLKQLDSDPEKNTEILKASLHQEELKMISTSAKCKQAMEHLRHEHSISVQAEDVRKRQYKSEIQARKANREMINSLTAILKEKKQQLDVLEAQPMHGEEEVTRLGYSRRILDIIRQISKQKQEIIRIAEDIQAIEHQLEMTLEELLQAQITTDDKLHKAVVEVIRKRKPSPFTSAASSATVAALLFHDRAQAKDEVPVDKVMVQCYKHFFEILELYQSLASIIDSTGKIEDYKRDLKNWITQFKGRDCARHLEELQRDLKSIQKENASILDNKRTN